MSTFIESPVWGAIITVAGSAALAVLGMMWRLMVKVDRLSDAIADVRSDIAEIKTDANVMRYSDMRTPQSRRKGHGF